MILVLEDRYGPPLSTSLKPKTYQYTYLTSQWRFNDVKVKNKPNFTDSRWKYAESKIFAKSPMDIAILILFTHYERKQLL